jgi:hypothetical protein
MADSNTSDASQKNPPISKATQRKQYLGGLLIGLCSALILFFISEIQNLETSSGSSPPSTTGQRAHP